MPDQPNNRRTSTAVDRSSRPAGQSGMSIIAVGAVASLAFATCAAAAAPGSTGLGQKARSGIVRIQGQPTQKPAINIGKVILAEPASETALPIQVGPLEAIPRNSFIRIRGLPHKASLSEGHSISPGAWAIPLATLPALKISLPVGLSGKSDVTVALVQIDGTVLAEVSTSLVVAAASLIAPGQAPPSQRNVASVGRETPALQPPLPRAAPVPAPKVERGPVQQAPRLSDEALKRATAFIERGRTQLTNGNVAAARLFFQRAADAGLAEGALAMAATFDPDELGRLRAAGVQPDLKAAREWYEKARTLGAPEADERLRRLGLR